MNIDKAALGPLLFHGSLDQTQDEGVQAILSGCDSVGITSKEQVSYVLATAYHESARRMQGIDEFGKGQRHSYGKLDPNTGFAYYGRGIVQLTWDWNYKKFSPLVGADLYHNPELCNRLDIAVKILCLGMKEGLFTGANLDRFINQSFCDFVGARAIINGTDANILIGRYAETFLTHLS